LIGLLSTLNMNRREVDLAVDKIERQSGWMTKYNVDHKFSSPYRVHEAMRSISYLPGSLKSLESQLRRTLPHYFDQFTVDEWLEQNVDPLIEAVDSLNSRAASLTSSLSWPRRPIVSANGAKDNEGLNKDDLNKEGLRKGGLSSSSSSQAGDDTMSGKVV
jgi:hypothetical protein